MENGAIKPTHITIICVNKFASSDSAIFCTGKYPNESVRVTDQPIYQSSFSQKISHIMYSNMRDMNSIVFAIIRNKPSNISSIFLFFFIRNSELSGQA